MIDWLSSSTPAQLLTVLCASFMALRIEAMSRRLGNVVEVMNRCPGCRAVIEPKID